MEFFKEVLLPGLVALIVAYSSIGILAKFNYFEGLTPLECAAVGCSLGFLGLVVGWVIKDYLP